MTDTQDDPVELVFQEELGHQEDTVTVVHQDMQVDPDRSEEMDQWDTLALLVKRAQMVSQDSMEPMEKMVLPETLDHEDKTVCKDDVVTKVSPRTVANLDPKVHLDTKARKVTKDQKGTEDLMDVQEKTENLVTKVKVDSLEQKVSQEVQENQHYQADLETKDHVADQDALETMVLMDHLVNRVSPVFEA